MAYNFRKLKQLSLKSIAMISKKFRLIVLTVGSILSFCIFIFSAFAGLFSPSEWINAINESTWDFLGGLNLNLYVVAVIIAWFNSKLGSFLITFFALTQFILWQGTSDYWFLILMLLVGLLLLFYEYSIKRILKKRGKLA